MAASDITRQRALKILNTLVMPGEKRQRRLTELLREPSNGNADWFMFVPNCFNAALDIQETVRISKKQKALVWTQGSTFSFSTGDIIYDSAKAYMKWSEALKHIRHCFHVTKATAVTPGKSPAQRRPGSVTFDLLVPNETRVGLMRRSTHDMTQDDFVQLLIAGKSSQLTLSPPDMLL